jgi:hypothetical protein
MSLMHHYLQFVGWLDKAMYTYASDGISRRSTTLFHCLVDVTIFEGMFFETELAGVFSFALFAMRVLFFQAKTPVVVPA